MMVEIGVWQRVWIVGIKSWGRTYAQRTGRRLLMLWIELREGDNSLRMEQGLDCSVSLALGWVDGGEKKVKRSQETYATKGRPRCS